MLTYDHFGLCGMSELWWPDPRAPVMSITAGKMHKDEQSNSICGDLNLSLQSPQLGSFHGKGLYSARTSTQRQLLITALGKGLACCHGPNFIAVAVAKPKKKMVTRIIFMELFPLKHKTCQLAWRSIPPGVCHPLGCQTRMICGWHDDVICIQQLVVISTPSPAQEERLLQ